MLSGQLPLTHGLWDKGVERDSGAGELYDLVRGRDEMDNRFDDPACQDVRAGRVAQRSPVANRVAQGSWACVRIPR